MLRPLILGLSLLSFSARADWVDEFFDNAVFDAPNSLDAQKRGFYNAGGFRARVDNSADHLATVTLPKIKAGCGGIDLFMGGFSFLDEDYLVEKLQNMIQAAPAVAFQMALSTMSDKMKSTITELEAATNWLNQIQVDDCAMTKTVIAELRKDDPDVLGAVYSEMTSKASLDSGVSRGYQEEQEQIKANNGAPTISLMDSVESCPAEYKQLFASGSMLENAAKFVGLESHADTMRGIIGDINIVYDETSRVPVVEEITLCPGNNNLSMEDILYGTSLARRSAADGSGCYLDSAVSTFDLVRNQLQSIADIMLARNLTLTPEAENIIVRSPIPVLPVIKRAIIDNNLSAELDSMALIIGSHFAHRMIEDLHRNISQLLLQSLATASPVGPDSGGGTKCDTKLFAHALEKFRRMNERLDYLRRESYTVYAKIRADQEAYSRFAERRLRIEQTSRERTSLEASK